jgi:hypothetical protein
LVDALVLGLRSVVPNDIIVESCCGEGVEVRQRGATFGLVQDVETIVDQDGDFAENVEAAADSVLSGIQEFVAECLTVPWPGRGTTMPIHYAVVRDDLIYTGFGEEDVPAIRCDSPPAIESGQTGTTLVGCETRRSHCVLIVPESAQGTP